MRREEVVDLRSGDRSKRKLQRGHFFRVAGPIGFVVIMLAALLAIVAYSYFSNRREALALSNEVLGAIERRIAGELEAFLKPIEDTVQLTATFLNNSSFDIKDRDQLEPLAFGILNNLSQITNFIVADTQGNFLMVARQPDKSLHTKIIERATGSARTTWIRRDPAGNMLEEETSVDDSYDPRNRPWFKGAVNRQEPYWTDFYIFYTSQTHGITISLPVMSKNDERLGVIGLDIELKAVSAFLETLKIGENGEAIIVDEEGYIVAHPEIDKMVKKEGNVFKPIRVEELGDTILNRAFSRFRIEGHGHRDLVVDNRRYLSSAFLMPQKTGLDLSVFIFVPEEDFVGFVARNNRNILLMSVGIIILAAILAARLVYQALRAEIIAQRVLDRQHELAAQSRAFSELSSRAAVFGTGDSDSFQELTEIVANAINLRRTSLWRFDDNAQNLKCIDSYDSESNGHTQGTVLSQDEFSELFDVLQHGSSISTGDAEADSRLTALFQAYLQPLGCRSLLAVPIRYQDWTAGALWFEQERMHRGWPDEDVSFAYAIANMLALRFSTDRKSMHEADSRKDRATSIKASTAPGPKTPTVENDTRSDRQPEIADLLGEQTISVSEDEKDRVSSFLDRLAAGGIDAQKTAADIFADTTVLALRFSDPITLAGHSAGDESTTIVDLLVAYLEEAAASDAIDYVKIMGEEIICAAGIDNDSNNHAGRIADLALYLQDRYSSLFASLNIPMEFRIGIDTGTAMGSSVGRKQKTYNIWGESVRFASKMAESGIAGGIQVSQTTYQRLQSRYLFQMRGRYYLPHVGESSTYLLTGHI